MTIVTYRWVLTMNECRNMTIVTYRWVLTMNECINRTIVTYRWFLTMNECINRTIVTYRWVLTMNECRNRTIVTSIVTYRWFLFVFQISWCSNDLTRSKNLITHMFWYKYLTPHIGIVFAFVMFRRPCNMHAMVPRIIHIKSLIFELKSLMARHLLCLT